METWRCPCCGGDKYAIENNYKICAYCKSKFKIEDLSEKTGISINKDIENLLQKCSLYPEKASKYANLILDIDPENKEAQKYL